MQQQTVTDLTFLKKFCENDPARISKYIHLFLSSAVGFRQKMTAALQTQNWDELANQAHSFRSTATMMGMNNSKKLLAKVEEDCRRGNITGAIGEDVDVLLTELTLAETELGALAKQ